MSPRPLTRTATLDDDVRDRLRETYGSATAAWRALEPALSGVSFDVFKRAYRGATVSDAVVDDVTAAAMRAARRGGSAVVDRAREAGL